jgi:hypothetical protein
VTAAAKYYPDLLTELRALGYCPYLAGEPGSEVLKMKGPRDPATGRLVHLPPRLIHQVREAKPFLIDALRAEQWVERVDGLFASFRRAGYSPDRAEQLAYDGALWEWHCRTTPRGDRGHCAGCGEPFDGPRIPYGDGSFIHSGCADRHARRWRAAAADALQEFGVHPPAGLQILKTPEECQGVTF